MSAHPLRRITILGGSGLLGAAVIPALEEDGITVDAPPSSELDVREIDPLMAHTRAAAPDMLINCAAQASVDRAEKDPAQAFQVNAAGAHNVALAAAAAGIPLVHISTDYVFDGDRRRPYREYHQVGCPPNQYGKSKLQGEILVRDAWRRHFIVRVSALFGAGGRPDFVDWVLASADPASPLTIVADRFSTPTWTVDLARQLLTLIKTPYFGTYHAAGHGPASWYELAHRALILSGKDPAGVVPIQDYELPSAAIRAPYTALDNHLLRVRGLDTMLPWQEALSRRLKADAATAT